jgi:uncharacterized protein YeaO (DUF488 family)
MTSHKSTIQVKRVYDEPEPGDGTRVLVDRLWPRGLSKEQAKIDTWLKDIAPSNELRKWFGHDPEKFAQFRQRYTQELTSDTAQEALQKLRAMAEKGVVTLLYAAHDSEHSNAIVLHDILLQQK